MNCSSFQRWFWKLHKESKECGVPIGIKKQEIICKVMDHLFSALECIIDDTYCACDILQDQGKICPHCQAVDIIDVIDKNYSLLEG